MKRSLFISSLILAGLLSGCSMVSMIDESTEAIHCNREAVEQSTEAIRRNIRAIEQSNQAIEENKRKLDEIRSS